MKCLYCKQEFMPMAVNQKFCSKSCGQKYRYHFGVKKHYPVIRFNCSCCGKTVETAGDTSDKRTRFCSRECEKKYWKHPHWERKGSMTTYQSERQYKIYEKSSNERT